MELNLNEAQSRGGSNSRVAIECSRAVLEQILADVEQGFYSVPHGGAEVGGVLFGSYDGSRIAIQAARPLLCEHAYGPSFKLSLTDYSHLAALLQVPGSEPDCAGMAVVGWYHSHTRSEISFADADIEIHDRFFPKLWQVALVLRPSAMKPTEVGLFVREADGTMCRSAPDAEASLTPAARKEPAHPGPGAAAAPRTGPYRNRQATAAVTPEHIAAVTQEHVAAVRPGPIAAAAPAPIIVAPREPPTVSPELFAAVPPAPVETQRWRWAAAAALFLVAIASAGYLSRAHWWPRRPAPTAPSLRLHATDRDGQLEIGWDGNLPVLRLARSGTLEIGEGPHRHIFPMDAEFLRRGSINYARHSEAVTVRISVTLQDGSELQQQWAFVGDLGSRRAVPGPVAAQQLPAPEATPEPARTQVAEIQALRKLRQGSELSGQALGSEQARQSPARQATQERTSQGASTPTSRAAAVQPVIAKPSPPAVTPPRSLPDRASTRAPVQTTSPRTAPAPRSGTAPARNQLPSSSANAAAGRGRPLPPLAPASAAPSPPPPAPSTPATSRPEPLAGNVAVRAGTESVARPPASGPTPPLNTVAPPARVEPATQPAVVTPSVSGQWTFGRTSPSGSPFPPESVALSLSEIGGLLQGTLAGRYRTPKSSGLKRDVRFSFQGPAHAGNMRFPWAASDGTKGSVELIRLPNRSDSIEVVWYFQDRKFIFDDVLVRVTK